MKIFIKQSWLFLLLIVLSVASCKKDDPNDPNNQNQNNQNNQNNNNNNNNTSAIKFLTIVDAKTLYISSKGTRGSSQSQPGKLYKVTDKGLVLEVAYLDEKGDTLTNVQYPMSICNLSDDYVLVNFQNSDKYIVRKSDGAVFDGKELPRISFFINDNPTNLIQYDGSGNIYYLGEDQYGQERNIVKLTLSDPSNIVVSRYSAAGDQPNRFCVDNKGNMAYLGASSRLRLAAGGFVNNPYGFLCTDINNDSIITCTGPTSYMVGNPIKIQFNKINTSPFGLVKYGDSATAWSFDGLYAQTTYVKMKKKQRIIAVYGGGIMQVNNPERQPSFKSQNYFGFTPYQNIEKLIASDNYYYMLGPVTQGQKANRLVKVNPDNNTFEAYDFTSFEYEVYSITVNADDNLQIYALRLSDGNRVLAEFSTFGVIKVIKVLDNEVITSLQQIN